MEHNVKWLLFHQGKLPAFAFKKMFKEVYKEAETAKAFSDELKKDITTLKEKQKTLTDENNLTEATKIASEIKTLEIKTQEAVPQFAPMA